MSSSYFTRSSFEFLKELAANNDKSWWENNRDRYVRHIREPALDLIVDFAPLLAEISPHFTADARVQGGSLMRPYRDMRFSKGLPYKTNVGIHFRHEGARDVHSPGFYVHIEPGQNFAGAGLWHPEARVARRIRETIGNDPDSWGAVAHDPAFLEAWEVAGHDDDRLVRIPKELDGIDHPYPDDLRLRSFSAGTRLNQKMVTSSSLPADLAKMFKLAAPYTRFICQAIGVPF